MIQAVLHGVWIRRQIKRMRAVERIQRYVRGKAHPGDPGNVLGPRSATAFLPTPL